MNAVLDRLRESEDVTPICGKPDQVLVYAGHLPPGVFVVTSGTVRIERSPAPLLLTTEEGPLLMPAIGELNSPAPGNVVLDSDANLLFVPRSLVLESEVMRELLAGDDLRVRSWNQGGQDG